MQFLQIVDVGYADIILYPAKLLVIRFTNIYLEFAAQSDKFEIKDNAFWNWRLPNPESAPRD